MSTLGKPRKHAFRFLFSEQRNRLGDCPWRGWMPDKERLMPRTTKLKLQAQGKNRRNRRFLQPVDKLIDRLADQEKGRDILSK